jgi:hypothetical protein
MGAPIKHDNDNCHDNFKMKMSVPMVLNKFHMKPFKFVDIKSLIVVVSEVSRESMSPVLILSKKPISCSIRDRKTSRLSRTLRRETPIVNIIVRKPPNMPEAK